MDISLEKPFTSKRGLLVYSVGFVFSTVAPAHLQCDCIATVQAHAGPQAQKILLLHFVCAGPRREDDKDEDSRLEQRHALEVAVSVQGAPCRRSV